MYHADWAGRIEAGDMCVDNYKIVMYSLQREDQDGKKAEERNKIKRDFRNRKKTRKGRVLEFQKNLLSNVMRKNRNSIMRKESLRYAGNGIREGLQRVHYLSGTWDERLISQMVAHGERESIREKYGRQFILDNPKGIQTGKKNLEIPEFSVDILIDYRLPESRCWEQIAAQAYVPGRKSGRECGSTRYEDSNSYCCSIRGFTVIADL